MNDQGRTTISATDMESNTGDEAQGENAPEKTHARVALRIISYRKRNHDPDGICAKYVIDGLVAAGILDDDSAKEISSVTFASHISEEEKTVVEIF